MGITVLFGFGMCLIHMAKFFDPVCAHHFSIQSVRVRKLEQTSCCEIITKVDPFPIRRKLIYHKMNVNLIVFSIIWKIYILTEAVIELSPGHF